MSNLKWKKKGDASRLGALRVVVVGETASAKPCAWEVEVEHTFTRKKDAKGWCERVYAGLELLRQKEIKEKSNE